MGGLAHGDACQVESEQQVWTQVQAWRGPRSGLRWAVAGHTGPGSRARDFRWGGPCRIGAPRRARGTAGGPWPWS